MLAARASLDSKHAQSGPPHRLANSRAFTKLVEPLVASEADINLQSGHSAAAGHSEVMAILLLKKSAKPDVFGGSFGTALRAAAS